MKTRHTFFLFVAVAVVLSACDNNSPVSPSLAAGSSDGENPDLISSIKNAMNDLETDSIPEQVNGIELTTIRGWFANIYPWDYEPEQSTVHPVENLWTPYQKQTPFQILEQARQLEDYGSGADVLEFNVAPGNPDYNHWLRVYLTNNSRPFFVLYEHVHGNTNYVNENGPKNMDLVQNRKAFTKDIEFFMKNVILPFQSRYVTHNGKAVIYLWSSVQMGGDFASLLEEVKSKYPVIFFGSGEIWNRNPKENNLARVKALDGFMEYTMGGNSNYLNTVQNYQKASFRWRQTLRTLEIETGKKYIFIPTFQAAYDDTKARGRTTPAMYPRTKEEMEFHAELIKSNLYASYDGIGPFTVYGELPEGAAVIESQCLPETINRPGRYTGCGTGRLEILKQFFGK